MGQLLEWDGQRWVRRLGAPPAPAGQLVYDPIRERTLYWEYRGHQALRRGRWKAFKRRNKDAVELYDLATDLGETTDVAAAHPEIVAELATLMQEERTASEHFPLPPKR